MPIRPLDCPMAIRHLDSSESAKAAQGGWNSRPMALSKSCEDETNVTNLVVKHPIFDT